jgi:PAS domain S-box-containing protein
MAQAIEKASKGNFTHRRRVLVAEGQSNLRQYLTRILSKHYEVDAAADASTALTLARKQLPDVVIVDVGIGRTHDFDLVSEFRRDAWGNIPVVLYSTASDAGTDDLILPFSERQLLAVVRAHVDAAQKRDESIQALRLSEERYMTLANAMNAGVWNGAADGTCIGGCQAWLNMTGQTPEQYRGWGWTNVIHPDDKKGVLEILQRALGNSTPVTADFRVRCRDGSYAYARTQGAPVFNPDGTVREWIGVFVDIDEQKRKDEALRTIEEEFRTNFELAGIGQAHTDPKTGRYLRVNKKFCEMVGYSADELQTMTYLDLTHPGDRSEGMDLLLDLLRHKFSEHKTDKRYIRKDGSMLWARVTSTSLQDAHDRPLRTITMIEDVTERRQWEKLSLCQKNSLQMVALGASLLEVLNFVAIEIEKLANIELRVSIQVLDESGKQFVICAAPSLSQDYRRMITSEKDLAGLLSKPVLALNLAGEPEWVEIAHMLTPYAVRSVWSVPITSPDQTTRGNICLYSSTPRKPRPHEQEMMDSVTHTIALVIERKQIESEREKLLVREHKAREMAESTSRMKDEFLAIVSHELRTPLNAINGWAYMLLNSDMDRDARSRALQAILRQVRSQCQLIDDLLDVARIVSGKLRLELREANPAAVISSALDVVRPVAEAKGVGLASKLERTVKIVVADPNRLQQVIWNLLSNAIKFTPKGGRVEIRSQRTDSGIEIVVADTGQGIAEDFLPYVFDRFRQADASSTRSHGGVGLGLAIVRHLIELHGGTVFAASGGKGKGATFTVHLPASSIRTDYSTTAARKGNIEPGREPVPEDREMLKGLRVLLVEDEPEDREVLAASLDHFGAITKATASAAEGLCELDRFRPDVLIADIGMPIEDGYALIRKIRTRPPDHGGLTPAIALTAYAGNVNRQRALETGYQKHMTKPADPNELARAILSLAEGTGEAGQKQCAPP